MESLRTLFRLVVMSGVLVIGYHGWKQYGPPVDRLKSLAVQLLDAAKSAIDSSGSAGEEDAALTLDPRPMVTPPPEMPPTAPTGSVVSAQALVPSPPARPAGSPLHPPALSPAGDLAGSPKAGAAVDVSPGAPAAEDDSSLLPLYSKLEELGAIEPRLVAWGSGQLYRFCCQASPPGVPGLQRQFEAIATEPEAAIAEVVEKVAAWRAEQRETAQAGGYQIR